VEKMSRIGLDTSKRIFQLHGVGDAEQPSLRNKLPRDRMIAFFQALPPTVVAPTVVAREACGASHHGSRVLGAMGHTVRLMGPRLAQPYVKRGLTDAADAEARCEAASRPAMKRCEACSWSAPPPSSEQPGAAPAGSRASRRSWPRPHWPTRSPASPGR